MIRCECGVPLRWRGAEGEGVWVHIRPTGHRPAPVFPEDPQLAGLPVHWELRGDGQLVRLDNP